MSNESINGSTEGYTDVLDFIEENIELLLGSGRSFIICSAMGIPPMLIKRDEDGIWVTLISEL